MEDYGMSADWAMVNTTVVYVIATIAIFVANIFTVIAANRQVKAANEQVKVTREQSESSKQQYDELLAATRAQVAATNEQVKVANEQVEVTREQLTANEEQYKKILAATADQVKAANEQVEVIREQLTETKQHYEKLLNATMEQVKAANEQVKVTREQLMETKQQYEEMKRIDGMPYFSALISLRREEAQGSLWLPHRFECALGQSPKSFYKTNEAYYMIHLTNLGHGAARDVRLILKDEVQTYDDKALPLGGLSPNQAIDVYFEFNLVLDNDSVDKLNGAIIIEYSDLFENRYQQEISLSIKRDSDNNEVDIENYTVSGIERKGEIN